jgi:hypothetical protein
MVQQLRGGTQLSNNLRRLIDLCLTRNEPPKISLCVQALFKAHPHINSLINPTVPPTTPPLNFEHKKGIEIPMKDKNAIRELVSFAKLPTRAIEARYKLSN